MAETRERSPTAKEDTSQVSRRLTRREINSLRQEMLEADEEAEKYFLENLPPELIHPRWRKPQGQQSPE
ncbi:MAG: hypothetical protein LBR29_04070 [Methylobacteriaceae bacterium]|nr:hypothetical protein [Methylobacteriaceae bacterium]